MSIFDYETEKVLRNTLRAIQNYYEVQTQLAREYRREILEAREEGRVLIESKEDDNE